MMKIGSECGSVVNHLLSRSVIGEPAPVVGMGASILRWSDRAPASVVAVESLKSKVFEFLVSVQEDDFKVVSGSMHDGSAVYEFSPNPSRYVNYFAKVRASGFWVPVRMNDKGRLIKNSGNGLALGRREKFQDPSQ